MKTNELTGAALDWAVANCEGISVRNGFDDNCLEYSTDWAQGGPIIEREGICINSDMQDYGTDWEAHRPERGSLRGETPLIAAMRCYVAGELGDEVEIPNELMKG